MNTKRTVGPQAVCMPVPYVLTARPQEDLRVIYLDLQTTQMTEGYMGYCFGQLGGPGTEIIREFGKFRGPHTDPNYCGSYSHPQTGPPNLWKQPLSDTKYGPWLFRMSFKVGRLQSCPGRPLTRIWAMVKPRYNGIM